MKLTTFSLFLALFLFIIPSVYADSNDYEITSVYVNGIQSEGSKVQVEIGTNAQVQIFLEGTGDTTDVRLRVWMGGYEYDTLETISDVFTVEDGVSYKKTIYLSIPEDLDVSNNEYTLYVEIFDSKDKERKSYTLYFEQERHELSIKDILVSSTKVAPGDYLSVKVRLENQGYKDEDDIKITVSISDLGISTRVYIDELISGDQDNAPTAYLVIPSTAAGNYEIVVIVEYNNGYSEFSESRYISVEGELVYDENTYVSVSSISDLIVDETSSYKVQVTNLGDSAKTFYLTIDGLNAEYTESITVPAKSSGEFIFNLSPDNVGSQTIFIEVTTSEKLVTQKLLNVNVTERNSALVYVVSVLLAIIVVFGLIFYLKKL